MFADIKTQKYQDETTTVLPQKNSQGFEEQLVGYNFLRNLWGTYFFDHQEELPCQDKLDHINKIVGMMKAQVRLMIAHEATHTHLHPATYSNEGAQFLQLEVERAKQSLERSKMREEEMYTRWQTAQREADELRRMNCELKEHMIGLKQEKNGCQERIIQLSNRLYELERRGTDLQENDNNLSQMSIKTLDKEEPNNPKVPLFSKRGLTSFHLHKEEVHSEDEDIQEQKGENGLNELDLNLPIRSSGSLRQSLQIYDKERAGREYSFIEEMKKMKQRTERIVEVENERQNHHRHSRRNTFAALPTRNAPPPSPIPQESRRFRRIRC